MRNLRHCRSTCFPANPEFRAQIDLTLPECKDMFEYEGSLLLLGDVSHEDDPDERILMIGSVENLKQIEWCNILYMDGKSWTVPFIFKELFSIHGMIGNKPFPLVFFLLPDCETATYEKAFQLFLDKLAFHHVSLHNLECIHSGCDDSLSTSFGKCFPNVNHVGCYSNFAQSNFYKVNELGLNTKYKDDEKFRTTINMCIALAFTPSNVRKVYIDAFINYLETLQDPDASAYFKNYFMPTWINKNHWKVWDWYLKETYNVIEGWHSTLLKYLQSPDLNVYKFIFQLRKEIATNDTKIRKILNDGNPSKRGKSSKIKPGLMRIQKQIQEHDCISYLQSVAYCLPEY